MMNKLVGRERECQELKRVMESDRSEFVSIWTTKSWQDFSC